MITDNDSFGVDSDLDGDALSVASIDGDSSGSATGSYGTLTWGTDGSYTYTLDNTNSAVQALDDGATLTDTFAYTVTDGDATDSANITVTINGLNDPPQVSVAGEGHTVYESGLPFGTDATASTEFATGDFTIADTDGLDDVDSVTIAGTTFTRGNDFTVLGDLVGESVDVGYGTIELTSYDGAGKYGYKYTLDVNVDNDSQAGATDATYDEVFAVSVSDGTTSDSTNITVTIVDDEPSDFDPTSGLLHNSVSATVTESLNSISKIGADGYTSGTNVTFDAAQEGDSGMTSGNQAINLYVSSGGKTLTGSTSASEGGVNSGNTVFTVAIDDSTDQYTVNMLGTIDNSSGASFEDLSGTGEAGNPSFKIVESTSGDNLELLFTPLGAATSVNSDSDDIAAGSQFIVDGDGLRVDFGRFSNDDKGTGTGGDDTFVVDGKETVNGFSFGIDQIAGGATATLTLTAHDAEGIPADYDLSNDLVDAITRVEVYDDSGSSSPLYTWESGDGTTGVFTDNGDGSVTVSGLGAHYSVATYTSDGYDSINVENAAAAGTDGKFSLSDLEVLAIHSGDPVTQSFDVILTDSDNDTSSGSIDVTFAQSDAIIGTSGADDLSSLATSGDDLIFGGEGNDTLAGSGGEDAFFFSANGGEGSDTITDFNVGDDTLSFTDLLDVEPDGDFDAADVLAFTNSVTVTVSGSDLVLDIPDQPGGGGDSTTITLSGVAADYGSFSGGSLTDLINEADINGNHINVDTYGS
jgi:VCBS repeat-containing protein